MPPRNQRERQDMAGRRSPGDTQPLLRPLEAEYATLRFDYEQIEEGHRRRVQDAALDIRQRERRAAEDMIVIGQRLLDVKNLLPHGQFMDWVDAEFHYGKSSVAEFMQIARRFAGKLPIIGDLPPTVMRLLAPPSVPDEAVEAVVAEAKVAAKPIKVAEARVIIARHMIILRRRRAKASAPANPTTIAAPYTVGDATVPSPPATGTSAGQDVTLTIRRALAEKLLVAVSTHTLRYFFTQEDQAQLLAALDGALDL